MSRASSRHVMRSCARERSVRFDAFSLASAIATVIGLFAEPLGAHGSGSNASQRNVVPSSVRESASSPGAAQAGAARTLRVRAREVILYAKPEPNSPRRGALPRGASVTVLARARGASCRFDWLLLGPSAWACSDPLDFEEPHDKPPFAPPPSITTFAKIGERGAIGYSRTDLAEQRLPDAELQPGFFVGIVEERSLGGELFVRTTHDLWIARHEVDLVVPSDFVGVAIGPSDATLRSATRTEIGVGATRRPEPRSELAVEPIVVGHLPVGWIYVDRAVFRKSVDGARSKQTSFARLTRMVVLEVTRSKRGDEWYRTEAGWLSEQQLRVPQVTTPPLVIGEHERWLDVDKRTQTLVAYEGSKPIFATLVSTGRGKGGSEAATPSGIHRVWVKLTSADMDNLDERVEPNELATPQPLYAVEAVPHVMFFQRGYGLHATYWHDAFGTPKSHGCVNLSMKDAARIFEFTSPKLEPGWQAVHPHGGEPGTVVRVR